MMESVLTWRIDALTFLVLSLGAMALLHRWLRQRHDATLARPAWIVVGLVVLAGIALSLGRRMRDNSAMTVQSFGMDFFPLILLFAISVTGLALTASTLWLRGQFYGFLSILHAITVISALLYLPFGKFFHMFQRPAQLGVKLYQDAGDEGEGALCASCGDRFASRMHIDDLNTALPELGFNYEMAGPARTWQEICPPCKRKTIARAQMRLKEESLG